jgi:uncharacterized protein YjiS (DUF1127 family)
MPCAGPDHSCNSLLSIRSPLGEVRLGEAIAHWHQRRALRELDDHLLKDIGRSQAEASREARLWSTATEVFEAMAPRSFRRFPSGLRVALERFVRQRLRFASREVNPLPTTDSASEVAREVRKMSEQ